MRWKRNFGMILTATFIAAAFGLPVLSGASADQSRELQLESATTFVTVGKFAYYSTGQNVIEIVNLETLESVKNDKNVKVDVDGKEKVETIGLNPLLEPNEYLSSAQVIYSDTENSDQNQTIENASTTENTNTEPKASVLYGTSKGQVIEMDIENKSFSLWGQPQREAFEKRPSYFAAASTESGNSVYFGTDENSIEVYSKETKKYERTISLSDIGLPDEPVIQLLAIPSEKNETDEQNTEQEIEQEGVAGDGTEEEKPKDVIVALLSENRVLYIDENLKTNKMVTMSAPTPELGTITEIAITEIAITSDNFLITGYSDGTIRVSALYTHVSAPIKEISNFPSGITHLVVRPNANVNEEVKDVDYVDSNSVLRQVKIEFLEDSENGNVMPPVPTPEEEVVELPEFPETPGPSDGLPPGFVVGEDPYGDMPDWEKEVLRQRKESFPDTYFAKIDENGIVERVVVGGTVEYLEKTFGGVWKETWPGEPGHNFASSGMLWTGENFITMETLSSFLNQNQQL